AVIIPSDTHHAQAAASGSPWSSGIGWCETLNMVLRSLLLAEVLTNALDAIRIVMITLAVEKGIDHRVGQHRPNISLFPVEPLFPIESHHEHKHDERGDGAEGSEDERHFQAGFCDFITNCLWARMERGLMVEPPQTFCGGA